MAKLDALDSDIILKMKPKAASRSLELAAMARSYARNPSGMKRILRLMELGIIEDAALADIPISRLDEPGTGPHGFWVKLTPAGRVVRQLLAEIENGDYQ